MTFYPSQAPEYWNSHDVQALNIHVNQFSATNALSNITTEPENCLALTFEDYIPWNNPDNIVSFEAEDQVRLLKDFVFLPVLFLIGCPANTINMLVFYKQGLKERINVCLFALSLADGLYMVINMVWFGEQLFLRFTTKEVYGPVLVFLVNNNLVGFHGFIYISQIISAIIASERCFCIMQPLRSKTVLGTSTMTVIIVIMHIIILALVFIYTARYHLVCAYDPSSGSDIMIHVPSEFYIRHQMLVDYLEFFVLGSGLPGIVIIVVVTTTITTTIKLRQAAIWRAGTSNSSVIRLSDRDIALTKMLVANSVFFVVCVSPFAIFRFLLYFMPEVNTGRRHHNFFLLIQWVLMIVSYFNASFNIVIYYTMGSRFRQTFWQLFGHQSKNKQPSVKLKHCR